MFFLLYSLCVYIHVFYVHASINVLSMHIYSCHYFLWSEAYPAKFIHKVFLDLSKKYGPLVRLENPQFPPAIMVTDPKYSEAMIRATMDNPLRYGFFSLKKIRYEAIDNYFERKGGLLVEWACLCMFLLLTSNWWNIISKQFIFFKSSFVFLVINSMNITLHIHYNSYQMIPLNCFFWSTWVLSLFLLFF